MYNINVIIIRKRSNATNTNFQNRKYDLTKYFLTTNRQQTALGRQISRRIRCEKAENKLDWKETTYLQ